MYKVIAYAETAIGGELRVPLGTFETEEQADKFCQSDDLCDNDTILNLCRWLPNLSPWDFLHVVLNVDE